MDKANPTVRKYLAERAELIGAIRLPNTAFKENAGTEVTADILFLQKRECKIDIEPDWVHLGYTDNGIAVNSYFAEHPEMILGTMEYDTGMYGPDSRTTTCVNRNPDFNLYEALNRAVQNLKAQIPEFEQIAEEGEVSEDVIPADPDVRNYTYAFRDGKLYYRQDSLMFRKELSTQMEDRVKLLDEIRKVTRHLIDIQTEGCSEEELLDGQKILNEKYDRFVAKYGAINSQMNSRAFRDDSDYPLLCSLEDVVREASAVLKPNGRFYMVHRPFRLAEIFAMCGKYKLEPKAMRLVYPFVDKEPNMVLIEANKGGKSRLQIEKPLIVYKEPNVYTDEIYDIYKPEEYDDREKK